MFDIHKVKPIHGWREFIGEVGIIVLGVLIALGAESAIERWHWHLQTDENRAALKEELLRDAVNAWERVALDTCLRSRLQGLLNQVNSRNADFAASPMPRYVQDPEPQIVQPAYAAPDRPYLDEAWKNTIGSGGFNHLDASERQSYTVLAVSIQQLTDAQEKEAEASTRLAPLSFDRTLSEQGRSDMIAAIAAVDLQERRMVAYSAYFLYTLQSMKLGFDAGVVEGLRRQLLNDQRQYRGGCVRNPPLHLN